MKRMMIIEDEYFLLESMTKFMKDLDQTRVVGYTNLTDAFKAIRTQAPDLIFSDIRLPDGSGLELITFLNQCKLKPPIVFISAYVADYNDRIPTDSDIMVLEKPVPMAKLVEIAREKLGSQTREYHFKLTDYLQIAAMGGHSVLIQIGQKGTITIVNGELWAAEDEKGSGEDAFKRLVAAAEVHHQDGFLSCKDLSDKQMEARTIYGQLDNLLLNAVFEEEQQLRQGLTPDPPSSDPGGKSLEELIELGVEKLLNKEMQAALDLFTSAHTLDPDNAMVNANIERLVQLGFVTEEVS